MASKNPHQQTAKKLAANSHRLNILRTFFYRSVMSTLIPNNFEEGDCSEEELSTVETYWCSEYHKCHAMKFNENVLCVLYNSAVPTNAMNLMTEKMFKQLTMDKQVCW